MSIAERPMRFNGDMVRAILAGHKTQTRRLVPEKIVDAYYDYDGYCNSVMPHDVSCSRDFEKEYFLERCPYGKPGDRLWVRETWANGWTYGGGNPVVLYRSTKDGYIGSEEYPVLDVKSGKYGVPGRGADASAPEKVKWHPSIHMPRWACRLLLEITDVRVERLQTISEADARAEGLITYPHDWRCMDHPMPDVAYEPYKGSPERFSCPKQAYEALWAHIYGSNSWAENPWVWAIGFKRVGMPI